MPKPNFIPLEDRILIQPDKSKEMSDGGIIIPDVAKQKPETGIVVVIGTGKKEAKFAVKEGDHVMYGKYSGQEITINKVDYLIIRQPDIMGIIS